MIEEKIFVRSGFLQKKQKGKFLLFTLADVVVGDSVLSTTARGEAPNFFFLAQNP